MIGGREKILGVSMDRIVTGMSITEVLKTMRGNEGYYITNTARDLSQSDFKNRILLHTDLLAAPAREKARRSSSRSKMGPPSTALTGIKSDLP